MVIRVFRRKWVAKLKRKFSEKMSMFDLVISAQSFIKVEKSIIRWEWSLITVVHAIRFF
jgi:hypothetical protein